MASYGHVSCFHCRWLVCNTPFFGLVCVTLFECHHVFPKLSLFFDKMSHTCSGFPVPSRESGLYQVHIALFPVTARNCLNFCRPKIGGKKPNTRFCGCEVMLTFKLNSFGDGLFIGRVCVSFLLPFMHHAVCLSLIHI